MEIKEQSKTAEKIRYMLSERGWSVYKLARKTNIPYSSLNNIFWRQTEPSVAMLEKICAAFGVSVSHFLETKTPVTGVQADEMRITRNISSPAEQGLDDGVGCKTDMLVEVGRRTRKRREALGYSRKELSEIVGISAQFIADIESGRKNMTIRTLVKLCRGLGCSAEYLINGAERADAASANAASNENEAGREIMNIFYALPDREKANCVELLRIYFKSVAVK